MDDARPGGSQTDDDAIIAEIPIYHSTRLQNSLYLLHYPQQPKSGLNELTIRRGLFKPENQILQLDMGIDVESHGFDIDRAELKAQEADGPQESRKTSNAYFENGMVDKVCLRSAKPLKDSTKYAALVYSGRELHLTTLKGIFNMTPGFSYLDKGSRRKKDSDHNDVSDDEEAGPSGAQQVTVTFKQTDDRWKKARPDTFSDLEAKSENEPWVRCDFHTNTSSLSKFERLKLLAENAEETGQATALSEVEYVKVLFPEGQEQENVEPTLPAHVVSEHALRALPVLDQCRTLLKHAKIIQFQQLLMTLAGSEGLTPELLLKTLPKVAVLVRGNWVVKSEVLYPENTFSATSGVPAELMRRARDYVLYLFTKNQYVERKKISSVMKIPSEEVKEIFTGFSRLSRSRGWELAMPTDHDFIVKHGEVAQKQKEAWDLRFKQLDEFLRDNKRQRRKSKSVSEEGGKVRNGPSYLSSDNDSGTEKNKSPVAARRQKRARENAHQDSSS